MAKDFKGKVSYQTGYQPATTTTPTSPVALSTSVIASTPACSAAPAAPAAPVPPTSTPHARPASAGASRGVKLSKRVYSFLK